jgi:hypothetical protein
LKCFPKDATIREHAERSVKIPLNPPEAVKKLLQIERAGRDIGKVLQRYLFALTTHDEKFQPSPLLGERCYLCPSNDRICKTLKIFLPDHRSQFFHSFPFIKGDDNKFSPLVKGSQRGFAELFWVNWGKRVVHSIGIIPSYHFEAV